VARATLKAIAEREKNEAATLVASLHGTRQMALGAFLR
jgi:hypothetical protein